MTFCMQTVIKPIKIEAVRNLGVLVFPTTTFLVTLTYYFSPLYGPHTLKLINFDYLTINQVKTSRDRVLKHSNVLGWIFLFVHKTRCNAWLLNLFKVHMKDRRESNFRIGKPIFDRRLYVCQSSWIQVRGSNTYIVVIKIFLLQKIIDPCTELKWQVFWGRDLFDFIKHKLKFFHCFTSPYHVNDIYWPVVCDHSSQQILIHLIRSKVPNSLYNCIKFLIICTPISSRFWQCRTCVWFQIKVIFPGIRDNDKSGPRSRFHNGNMIGKNWTSVQLHRLLAWNSTTSEKLWAKYRQYAILSCFTLGRK